MAHEHTCHFSKKNADLNKQHLIDIINCKT
jgi:hypothetical protein